MGSLFDGEKKEQLSKHILKRRTNEEPENSQDLSIKYLQGSNFSPHLQRKNNISAIKHVFPKALRSISAT